MCPRSVSATSPRPYEMPILWTAREPNPLCGMPKTVHCCLLPRPECIGESEGCAWDPSSCTGAVHSTDNDQPAPTDTSTPRGHEEGGKTSTSSEETSTALTCKDGYTWNELHACTEDLECVTCLYGPGADECRTSPDAADYYELDCSDANAAWLCCVLRDETCAKNAKFAALAGEILSS